MKYPFILGSSSTVTTFNRKTTVRKTQRYSMSVVQDKKQKETVPMWVYFHTIQIIPQIYWVEKRSYDDNSIAFIAYFLLSSTLFSCKSSVVSNEMRNHHLRISNRYIRENFVCVRFFLLSQNQAWMYCTLPLCLWMR